MKNKNFMVQGTQTEFHKLLITTLPKNHNEEAASASFQLLKEDQTVALELPLRDVLSALDALKKNGAQLIVGYRIDDYLILDWPKGERDRKIVQVVAVREAVSTLSSRFFFDQLRQAVYNAFMQTEHSS